jgi:hypothetical protein
MAPDSTQQGQMLPPPRRPYKRISSKEWEDQKDCIRDLFIVQDKTHNDVVRILKESYGFDVGSVYRSSVVVLFRFRAAKIHWLLTV